MPAIRNDLMYFDVVASDKKKRKKRKGLWVVEVNEWKNKKVVWTHNMIYSATGLI